MLGGGEGSLNRGFADLKNPGDLRQRMPIGAEASTSKAGSVRLRNRIPRAARSRITSNAIRSVPAIRSRAHTSNMSPARR